MLAVLLPGVNFINILRAAFVPVDPESIKNADNLTDFFAHSGSTLMKLSPGV